MATAFPKPPEQLLFGDVIAAPFVVKAPASGGSLLLPQQLTNLEDDIGLALVDKIIAAKNFAVWYGNSTEFELDFTKTAMATAAFTSEAAIQEEWDATLTWSKLHVDSVLSTMDPVTGDLEIVFGISVVGNFPPLMPFVVAGLVGVIGGLVLTHWVSEGYKIQPGAPYLTGGPSFAAAFQAGAEAAKIAAPALVLALLILFTLK